MSAAGCPLRLPGLGPGQGVRVVVPGLACAEDDVAAGHLHRPRLLQSASPNASSNPEPRRGAWQDRPRGIRMQALHPEPATT